MAVSTVDPIIHAWIFRKGFHKLEHINLLEALRGILTNI